MSEILVCEVEVGEGLGPDGGARERCPFLIPDLEDSDYCGYYGKDIGEDRKRLGNCKVEAVVERAEAARRRNKEKGR